VTREDWERIVIIVDVRHSVGCIITAMDDTVGIWVSLGLLLSCYLGSLNFI
jgi:hypothetical protein